MYDTVHFSKTKILTDMPSYLKKHRIVYKTPAYKGYEGLAAGNGELGVVHWNTTREAVFALNHSDAIDWREDGNFGAWAWEEEENATAVVSCANMRFTDGLPSFETMLLKDFSHTLELSDATVRLNSQTAFSSWSYESWVSAAHGCHVVSFNAESSDMLQRTISLERFGSRSFYHYYESYRNDADIKAGGTRTWIQDGVIFLSQQLRKSVFVVCTAVSGVKAKPFTNGSHYAGFALDAAEKASGLVRTAVCCGTDEKVLAKKALQRVRAAEQDANSRQLHTQEWNAFWNTSFVHLGGSSDNEKCEFSSDKTDYLENLYYIHLYQMQSSGRGKTPPLFSGSLWLWNHDSRNWGHVYHWNQQQQYWALPAAGHSNLINNYWEYRFAMLQNAKSDAKALFGAKGAFYSDVCNLNGYQALEPDTVRNCTVGTQIAIEMYRCYKYTQDENFLQQRVLPMQRECVLFYQSILKEENGVFQLHGVTAYESYLPLNNTLTDWVALQELLPSFIEIVNRPDKANCIEKQDIELAKWAQNALEHLYLPPVAADKDGDVFSCGIQQNGDAVGFFEGSYPRSPFIGCVLSAVYPAAIPQVLNSFSSLNATAQRSVKKFLTEKVYANKNDWCGHTPLPQIAARMNLAEDTLRLLLLYAEKFQCYPNGFTHYADITDVYHDSSESYQTMCLSGNETSTQWDKLHEKSYGTRMPLSAKEFYQPYNETIGNICAGVTEMLLQSSNKVIKVFPALPKHVDAAFCLWAQGNVKVQAEQKNSRIWFIALESTKASSISVLLPWSEPFVLRSYSADGKLISAANEYIVKDNVVSFNAQPNAVYVLEQSAYLLDTCYSVLLESRENSLPKKLDKAMLGKVRNF